MLVSARTRRHILTFMFPIFGIFLFVLCYVWRFNFSQRFFSAIGMLEDSGEELARGYYIAHEFILYKEIAHAHMPGLAATCSIVFRLLGFGDVPPSHQTLLAIERAGMATTGLLQVTIFLLAGVAARLSLPRAAGLAVLLVFFLWEAHGFFIPLAETWLIPLVTLLTVLIYRVLQGDQIERIIYGILFICAAAYALSVGLAIALLVTSWTVIVVAMMTVSACALPWRTLELPRARILGGAAAVLTAFGYAIYIFIHVDIKEMYYWVFEFNLEVFSHNFIDGLVAHTKRFPWSIAHVRTQFADPETQNFPFVGSSMVLCLALIGRIAMDAVRLAEWPRRPGVEIARSMVMIMRVTAFPAISILGYLLLGWRYPGEYVQVKALPSVGVPLGILVTLAGSLAVVRGRGSRGKYVTCDPNARRQPILLAIGYMAAAIVLAAGMRASLGAPRPVAPRLAVFDESRICRLGDANENCFCILETFYGPRQVLEFDVQPCLGFSPDHFHMIAKAARTRQAFAEAAKDDRVAFMLFGRNPIENKQTATNFWVPSVVYDDIVNRRTCRRIDDWFSVCAPPR
jgi:hypothetical protein